MAEFPALPLFTDAYLADTRHLTAEEHGAYLLLLMCAWRTRGCALKDCDRTLARTVGVTRLRWKKLRPTLMEFFTVEGGLWRQKKLTDVYKGVEARVAKNRANGAKGGRAKAAKGRPAGGSVGHNIGGDAGGDAGVDAGADERGETPEPNASKTTGGGYGEKLPAKTRIQTPKPEAAAVDTPAARLAAAAGISEINIDGTVVHEWEAAGACMEADILPTLRRIATREVARTGRVPKSLAYYTAAVLEARDARLGAVASGKAHAENHPPAPSKRIFNPASEADWRLFLGDANSRFRGDYLSQNWAIGPDNPHFKVAGLGPDPRHSINDRIPKSIMDDYAARWRWRRP
ncbi:YdaU family protein [Kordiimonas aestuarii]|uniref:YdaU family protein n=1 Tax=Kordiimonas aestuarii TaxID=1005925 RepID=UPI0021CF16D3|nr:DUF1376 domain-containing protein [Kordiimonas aestuarii]